MPNDSAAVWIAILALVLLLIVQWLLQFRQERQRREQMAQFKRDIEIIKQTVGALCSSAVGVDKRVNRLEQQGRDLEERQDNFELQTQQGEPPYSDAIRMVQEGAGAEALVEELGISRDAADLIILMHGMKRESID